MTKILLSGAAVAMALSAFSTPAFATIDPIYGGTYPQLDQTCDELMKPDSASGFVTYAIVDTAGATVTYGTKTFGATTTTGIGPATTTIGNYNGAHVNGQSVNIHAYGDTVTSYAGGASTSTPWSRLKTTSTPVTCHVHKSTPGNGNDSLHGNDYTVAPPGLQTDQFTSLAVTTDTGTDTGTIQGPWIDLNATTYHGEMVICISPTRNPGQWRGANGYPVGGLGAPMLACSKAWHDALLGGQSPSVSVPNP